MQHRILSFLCLTTLFAACDSGMVAPPSGNPNPPATGTPTPPPTPPPGGEVTPPSTTPPTTGTAPPSTTPPATTPPSGETTPPPVMPPPGEGTTPPPAPGSGPKGPFTCTLVLGISATGDWFNGGFEKVVDGNRWEAISVHNAFVNNWADPADPLWNHKPSSACAMNANNPDRIVIESLYLHWMDATVEQWVAVLEKLLTTAKGKFSNLRNLELSSFVRSPTDMPCPGNMPFKSFIRPEQDMADAMMAAKHPDIVTVAPVIRVDSCADYNGNPPHFTSGGSAAKIGAKVGAVYKDRQ